MACSSFFWLRFLASPNSIQHFTHADSLRDSLRHERTGESTWQTIRPTREWNTTTLQSVGNLIINTEKELFSVQTVAIE